MSTISLQVSVYPLRQPDLAPAVEKVLASFRARGLDIRSGSMSTVVVGESDRIFEALQSSFEAAAVLGDVVMVVSISNCCPVAAEEGCEVGVGQ